MKVSIGVSARHLHITEEDFVFLFGKNKELKKFKDLNQKGEFASVEKVVLKTEKGEIPNVRILGPFRDYTQVEISKTDAFKLGLNPPVRTSGDLKNSETVTICYKDKELKKENSCIISNRHIHMNYKDAFKLGFKENQKVKVKLGGIKGGILDNVFVKIKESFVYELHIDTDDANAHLVSDKDTGVILIDE